MESSDNVVGGEHTLEGYTSLETGFTQENPAHEELKHEEKFCRGDKILQKFQLVDPNVHQNGLTAKGLSSSKLNTKYEFKLSYLARLG